MRRCVVFALSLLAGLPAQAGDLESVFPKPPIFYFELERGSEFSSALQSSGAWKELFQSPAAKAFFESEDGQRFEAGCKTAESFLGREPFGLAVDVLGSRMAAGVWDKDSWALIALPEANVEDAFEKFANLAAWDAQNRRESKDGVDLLIFPTSTLARSASGALVLASGPNTALTIVKALRPAKAQSARLTFRLDIQALRKMQGKTEPLPEPAEPGGILIAGGWTALINQAKLFSLDGHLDKAGALSLEGRLDAGTAVMPEETRPLHAPAGTPAAPEAGEAQIASLSLARDFGLFWKQRRALFPAPFLPKLAETENILNAMFSGSAEDAFDALQPRLTLIAAPQAYAQKEPRLKVPGFALVAGLSNPEQSGPRFLQAFQSGVVLANVGRAQQQPGSESLTLDTAPATEGRQLMRAHFLARELAEEDQGMRYNLSPACGVHGNQLVLSSAEGTAQELLSAAPAKDAASEPTDVLVLHGRPLADALDAAMPWLVSNQMLEEGKTREKATSDLQLASVLARSVGTLRAEIQYGAQETRLLLSLR